MLLSCPLFCIWSVMLVFCKRAIELKAVLLLISAKSWRSSIKDDYGAVAGEFWCTALISQGRNSRKKTDMERRLLHGEMMNCVSWYSANTCSHRITSSCWCCHGVRDQHVDRRRGRSVRRTHRQPDRRTDGRTMSDEWRVSNVCRVWVVRIAPHVNTTDLLVTVTLHSHVHYIRRSVGHSVVWFVKSAACWT